MTAADRLCSGHPRWLHWDIQVLRDESDLRGRGGDQDSRFPQERERKRANSLRSDSLQGLAPKLTSLVPTVPAVRPGAVW
jgi:hypothetical protein